MDRKNHRKRVTHVLLSTIAALVIVFVGVPLFAGVAGESLHATFVLLVLIVCSYSTLYLR